MNIYEINNPYIRRIILVIFITMAFPLILLCEILTLVCGVLFYIISRAEFNNVKELLDLSAKCWEKPDDV